MINIDFPFKSGGFDSSPLKVIQKNPANVTTESGKIWMQPWRIWRWGKILDGKVVGFLCWRGVSGWLFLLGGLYIIVCNKKHNGSFYTDHTPITTATSRKSLPKMVVSAPTQTWMINLMMPLFWIWIRQKWTPFFCRKMFHGAIFVQCWSFVHKERIVSKFQKNDIVESKGTGTKFQLSWYPLWGTN